MDLPELAALIEAATEILRVDSLDAYDPSSDPDLYVAHHGQQLADRDQVWLGRLTAAVRGGHPRRRLRIFPRPVPDDVRSACLRRYPNNVAAGEVIRVLEPAHSLADTWRLRTNWPGTFGDVYVLDGELIGMTFSPSGQFVSAARASESDAISTHGAASIVAEVEGKFQYLPTFSEWWAANPELHRNGPGAS